MSGEHEPRKQVEEDAHRDVRGDLEPTGEESAAVRGGDAAMQSNLQVQRRDALNQIAGNMR